MVAFLAAFALLATGQAKLNDPPEPPPATTMPAELPGETSARPPPQAPDLPPAEAPGAPSPARAPAPPPRPALVSLLSGDTLHGEATTLAWAGWPALGAAWGQGITAKDDLGLLFQYDWAATEMLIGGWYRRSLGKAAAFDMAGRLGIFWYANHEGTLVYEDNQAAHGVQVAPSLLLSIRGGGGIFSLSGELPMTVTLAGGGGFLFRPRASLAYEAALYDRVTLGIRGGIGYRVGSGDAPLRGGMTELELVVLGGYRL
ncbi:MAG TPA: hypothetical protein VLS93_09210 [Anaeromyxobacteraceae bacterium]|nr:hypothetical protein [Anaeromyxobacteraceae bacterium]